jgi:hypothetical protein
MNDMAGRSKKTSSRRKKTTASKKGTASKKKAAEKKDTKSTEMADVELSKSDKKKIKDGKFFVSEVDTLRLQNFHTKLILWSERYEGAQKALGESMAGAQRAKSEFEKEVADVKLRYGLGDEYDIGLGDENGGRVLVAQQPSEDKKKNSKDD